MSDNEKIRKLNNAIYNLRREPVFGIIKQAEVNTKIHKLQQELAELSQNETSDKSDYQATPRKV